MERQLIGNAGKEVELEGDLWSNVKVIEKTQGRCWNCSKIVER